MSGMELHRASASRPFRCLALATMLMLVFPPWIWYEPGGCTSYKRFAYSPACRPPANDASVDVCLLAMQIQILYAVVLTVVAFRAERRTSEKWRSHWLNMTPSRDQLLRPSRPPTNDELLRTPSAQPSDNLVLLRADETAAT